MSLQQALRSATSDLHVRLDSGLDLAAICQSEEPLCDYLEAFQDALTLCWEDLDWGELESLGLGLLGKREARYRLLAQDLAAWGRATADLGRSSGSSPARTAGIAYVLEGSMHGGSEIARRVRKNLGDGAYCRVRFLRGFGSDTPVYWSGFVSWLDSLPAHDSFTEESCAAARWAFENFIRTTGLPAEPGVVSKP